MRPLFFSLLLLFIPACGGNRAFNVQVLTEGAEIRWGEPSSGLVAGVANEQPKGRGWVRLACYLKNVSDAPLRVLAPGGRLRSPATFELRQEVSGEVSDTPDTSDAPQVIVIEPGQTHRLELPLTPEVDELPYRASTRFVYTNIATEVLSGGAAVGELWTGQAASGEIEISASVVVRKGLKG